MPLSQKSKDFFLKKLSKGRGLQGVKSNITNKERKFTKPTNWATKISFVTLWIAELRSNLLKSTSSEQDSGTCIENWLSEGESRGNNGEEGKSHKGESEKESYSGSLNLGGGFCLTSRNSSSFDGFLMINERLYWVAVEVNSLKVEILCSFFCFII